MGHSLKIKADAYLMEAYNTLSGYTGKAMVEDVFADAVALAASALKKTTEGYVIQTVQQSVGQDKFSYPIIPEYIHQSVKRREPALLDRDLFVSLSPQTVAELDFICNTLNLSAKQDALHYSAAFSLQVANALRDGPGRISLAYIDSTDRRFGMVAKTPYDRNLRNDFNRLLNGVQDWWKFRGHCGPCRTQPACQPLFPLKPQNQP